MTTLFKKIWTIILLVVIWGCNDNSELEEVVRRFNEEVALIDQYIADNGLTAFAHPSGLRIVYTEEEGEQAPTNGQTVTIDYIGFLLDANNTVFDSSLRHIAEANGVLQENRQYQPEEFQLGVGQAPINGWEIGVSLMGERDRALVLLPSGLAYGSAGFGDLVPPNTVVGFDIQLLEVRD